VPSPYTAEGSGLQITAPKAPTGFAVHSIQGRRLRVIRIELAYFRPEHGIEILAGWCYPHHPASCAQSEACSLLKYGL
jgi:hypothetical protein